MDDVEQIVNEFGPFVFVFLIVGVIPTAMTRRGKAPTGLVFPGPHIATGLSCTTGIPEAGFMIFPLPKPY